MKTPIRWYGGKTKMLKHILPLLKKPHKKYVECFAGGAAVYFAKPKSPVEILNDKNGNLSTFYRQSKIDFDELNTLIQSTLHCEHTYNRAKEIYNNSSDYSDTEVAWSVFVGAIMSFGGNLFSSFQITTNSTDNCNPAVSTKNKKVAFQKIHKRLDRTMILEKDALEIIKKYNQSDSLIYADPPYFNANQGHYKGYTYNDFVKLLLAFSPRQNFKGHFVLSSYQSDVLKWFTNRYNWNQIEITQRLGVKNGATKTEVLTWNFNLENTLF